MPTERSASRAGATFRRQAGIVRALSLRQPFICGRFAPFSSGRDLCSLVSMSTNRRKCAGWGATHRMIASDRRRDEGTCVSRPVGRIVRSE